MARPSHSWDTAIPDSHSWDAHGHGGVDDSGDTSGSDSDAEGDRNLTHDAAVKKLLDILIMLYMGSEISARTFCLICWYASAAGITGLKRYGYRSSHTGHYQRYLDRILRFKDYDATLYDLPIPRGKAKPCAWSGPCRRCRRTNGCAGA